MLHDCLVISENRYASEIILLYMAFKKYIYFTGETIIGF